MPDRLRVTILLVLWGVLPCLPISAQESHLRILAATGTADQIQRALAGSSEINKRDTCGVSTLMLAARSNQDSRVISLLLSAGANINARNRNGETPLIYAAEYNRNPDIVSVLLSAGASVNDRDALGRTALMYAAWLNSNPAVVSLLLKAGADAKARSVDGNTALDYAQNNDVLKGTETYHELEKAVE